MTGLSSINTSIFSGALAGAVALVAEPLTAALAALVGDPSVRALASGARNIFQVILRRKSQVLCCYEREKEHTKLHKLVTDTFTQVSHGNLT